MLATRLIVVLASAVLLGGCKGSVAKAPAAAAPTSANATCTALGGHVARFGEALEDAGESGKARRTSFAGLLEMLLTFERATGDLDAQMGTARSDDASMRDVLKRASAALQQGSDFARTERERLEKHAATVLPLAKEADLAYPELKALCEGRRAPRECPVVLDAVRKSDAGPFTAQVVVAEDLAGMNIRTPAIARARDRAVTATRAVAKSVDAHTTEMASFATKWAVVEKSVAAAFEGFAAQCRNAPPPPEARFIADAQPDLRKLTLLVRVKPPAGIDGTFEELAARAKDEETRAFYQGRARGAFGSGFVLVRNTASGGTETLVITNRHVVELADRAALELADGTNLGPAEIIYTDSLHDVAVLRPTKKLPFEKGFAFAVAGAKDQQGVVATGFPGMGGRPSYQITRGYVSNESFHLEEATKPLVYVQHTAPIDPGSSGGPLTDERGFVLGVNTLKVTGREAVGLAVPAESILETIRRSDASESKRGSASYRRDSARLACLGFVAELALKKPRMLMLETMISNSLTGSEGLDAAMAIDDEEFGQMWRNDSVRAMRIATLFRLGNVVAAAGGASLLETCSEVSAEDVRDILTADDVRYRIRLANGETREAGFRFEQGHWKLARMELHPPKPTSVAAKLAPATKPSLARPSAKKKK